MDISVIISAVLALIGSLVGTFAGIVTSNKLTTYRIKQLEKQVEKHNNIIDRVYKLERHGAIVDEGIKNINQRIDNLEGK